ATFFFNDTATTEIYALSLHDALPISAWCGRARARAPRSASSSSDRRTPCRDRKSTRLNSSHITISYAGFSLKKQTDQIGREHVVTSATSQSRMLSVA